MPYVSTSVFFLACGAGATAVAWLGPLPELAAEHRSASASAALHVIVVCLAAPLLAAGAAGSRFDPVVRRPHALSPLAASLLQWGVVWCWHVPAAQLAIGSAPVVLWLQHVSILLASTVLWLSVLGGERATRYERAGAGIVALLLTSVHMTLLGGLAMISNWPLGGLDVASSVEGRRLGAILTLSGAAAIYAVAGAMLLAWLLRPQLPHIRSSSARYQGRLPKLKRIDSVTLERSPL